QLPRAGVLAARASGLVHEPRLRARLAQVLGRLEFETGTPLTAARIAVDGLERVDPGDRATALSLGDQALLYTWYSPYDPEQDVLLARIERAMRPVGAEAATGLRLLWAQDYSRALPLLRISVAAQPEPTRLIGTGLGLYLADPAVAHVGAAALVAHHRTNGLAGALPQALVLMTTAYLLTGRHRDAKTAAADALRIAHDTGQSYRVGHLTALRAYLAAASGDDDGQSLAAEAVRHSADGTRMANTAWAEAALALRDGAAGRFGAALERLEAAAHGPGRHSVPVLLGLPDHVEAAVRAERPELAAAPLARFAAWAEATGQPAVLGTAARCRALTSTGSAAESAYAEAAELHAEAGQRFEQARTELVYGEWLRRQRRRGEARARLAVAVELLDELGNVAWLERACGELRATGAPAPTTSGGRDPLASLTPQERQVVRLAATGASNREIAAQLFLSARTVGYHLYKAFPKLGVSNRAQLARFDLPVTP
ncbi:helix-turn-helix domain-containing protein, partial [Micromonospora chersina]